MIENGDNEDKKRRDVLVQRTMVFRHQSLVNTAYVNINIKNQLKKQDAVEDSHSESSENKNWYNFGQEKPKSPKVPAWYLSRIEPQELNFEKVVNNALNVAK
jgi:hypothetical protein